MALGKDLRFGVYGIRLTPPEHLLTVQDNPAHLRLTDQARGIDWHLSFGSELYMSLAEADREHLRRHVERHARSMFDGLCEKFAAENPNLPRKTDDPFWSPMIDVEYLEVDGTTALRTVHRMVYQPGHEVIMGHLLVPLRGGLFEARAITSDRTTGYRESCLLVSERPPGDPRLANDPFGGMRQCDYDDPRHDALFSHHCLSRSREALRSLQETWNLRVIEGATAPAIGEIALPRLGCLLTPPPRFVRQRPDEERREERFVRVSFCTTDGIDYFNVERPPGPRVRANQLVEAAIARSRVIHEASEVKDIRVAAQPLREVGGRAAVVVLVEGRGHQGPLRNALQWLIDERGDSWLLTLAGATPPLPGDELIEELAGVARSFRLTEPTGPAAKPWWKVW